MMSWQSLLMKNSMVSNAVEVTEEKSFGRPEL